MPAPLAVYMPVYNAAAYLAAAIESILAQNMRDFAFVIVDDGSTDASAEIVRGYAGRDPRIVAVFAPHRGLVPTIEAAIERVDAPLIARMDADDVSLPGRLAAQLDHLTRHSGVALLGAQAELIDPAGNAFDRTHLPTEPDVVAALLLRQNAFVTPTTVCHTAVHRSLGGFRSTFSPADDYDLWLRIADAHKVANLPDVHLRYRVHSASISHQKAVDDATSAAIARKATRLRRAGGADPVIHRAVDDPRTLAALGLTRAELDREIGDFMLGKAFTVMARDPSLAETYLAAARERLGAIGARQLVTFYRGCAEGAWAAGRPLAAARLGAKMLGQGMAWAVGGAGRQSPRR